MPSLYDVQDAWEDGKRREAVALLRDILREDPSANAWYMAATMTNDKNEKVRHLQRALQLNPSHRQSQQLLERLGVKNASFGGTVVSEVGESIFERTRRFPIIGQLPPAVQLLFAAVIVFIVVYALTLIASGVGEVAQDVSEQIEQNNLPPTPVALSEYGMTDVLNRLQAVGAGITETVLLEDTGVSSAVVRRITYAGTDGNTRQADIIVFSSIAAIDGAYLQQTQRFNYVEGRANVVAVASRAMPEVERQYFFDLFKSALS